MRWKSLPGRSPMHSGWMRPLLASLLMSSLIACDDDLPTSPPSDDPLIEGWITAMGPGIASSSRLTILVEEDPEDPGSGGYDKIYFFLDSSTPVQFAVGKAPRRMVEIEGLAVGQRVRVWYDGIILDSYPAQAGTDFIVVVCESAGSFDCPPR